MLVILAFLNVIKTILFRLDNDLLYNISLLSAHFNANKFLPLLTIGNYCQDMISFLRL